MQELLRRPFYSEYAWAYELLIDRPVRKESAAITRWLVERGVLPGATLLDAGCGTGRYSIELARRGYVVEGIDVSPQFIELAVRAAVAQKSRVTFSVGNIVTAEHRRYAAILCRGVLNDILDDGECEAVFASFANALQPRGVLVLDVREWHSSAQRKAREPLFRKRVSTDHGDLTFTSVAALDLANRRLVLSERHVLANEGIERVSNHQFVMRCWELDELHGILTRHGFARLAFFGAYDPAIGSGSTDRLVAVAQLADSSQSSVAAGVTLLAPQ
jgi:SAM-dependent methyltransferase